MNLLPIGLIALLLAAAPRPDTKPTRPKAPPAPPPPVTPTQTTTPAPPPADPIEAGYQRLLELDDAAQEDAERMAKENQQFQAAGAGLETITLQTKIKERLDPVRKAYEEFILLHPKHAKTRLAYGSFLNEQGDELGAAAQWERGLELDPTNPAAWNNLANHYAHRGPVKKAFDYYAKAIELNPREAVYHHNLGTTVFLFRKDAMELYGISEQQVFDRALAHYQKALDLDPKNFDLAEDVAQTYYGIKPLRFQAALASWNHALSRAADDVQKEGVYIHLARLHIMNAEFDKAREFLAQVKLEAYADLKARVARSLNDRETKHVSPSTAPE